MTSKHERDTTQNDAESVALVQCEECGKHLAALPWHLHSKHDMSVETYREKHGVTTVRPTVPEKVTREELVKSLKNLAEELGRTPKTTDLGEHTEYSTKPYYDHFGSWKNALREAGIDPE